MDWKRVIRVLYLDIHLVYSIGNCKYIVKHRSDVALCAKVVFLKISETTKHVNCTQNNGGNITCVCNLHSSSRKSSGDDRGGYKRTS